MHVLIVTHNLHRGEGQARVNYEVARHLVQWGHRVTAIAGEVADDLSAHPGFCHIPVRFRHWPTALIRNEVFSLKATRLVRRLRQEADVVMACGYVCWARTDVNAVHFVHRAWLASPYHEFRQRQNLRGVYHLIFSLANAAEEHVAFRRSLHIITVSEFVRKQVLGHGVPPERVSVIVNGVDTHEFKPAAHQELADEPGVARALFIGDLNRPVKNVDTVLRALARTERITLDLAGRCHHSPYPALARSLGLDSRARFLGYQRDVPALLAQSDFLVAPSRYDSCSLVVLEAMAAGLPVITARTVGASELLTSDAGIVLDDPNDVDALAAAMQRLARDPALRRRMGTAARRIAEEHSWECVAREYLLVFERVASDRRSSR